MDIQRTKIRIAGRKSLFFTANPCNLTQGQAVAAFILFHLAKLWRVHFGCYKAVPFRVFEEIFLTS